MAVKMKILYIVSTLEGKGPTNQLFGLIKNLDKNKFDPYILTLSPEKGNSRLQDFLDLGVSFNSLNMSRLTGALFGKTKVRRFVENNAPDLIHTQGIRADNIALRLPKQYSYCNTVRNYAYDDYVMKFGKMLGTLFAGNHIRTLKKSDNPIACSKSISQRIYQEHGISVDYIQNGIDQEKFSPVTIDEKRRLREKLKLDIDKTIFVLSGSLIVRKDPVLPILAFKGANVENLAQLVVLGDGDVRQECEVAADGHVKFMGIVNNVADYLKASDVFISASKSEGLPNAVLEAMGTSLPVLLSDIVSHQEIMERDPNIGDIFPVGDVDSLIELIRKYVIIVDLHEKSKKSREVLCKYFSASIMSKKYQEKYESILNNRDFMLGAKNELKENQENN